MEKTYTIYKFTFSDGKVYIGQTSQQVEDRWCNGEGYKGQDVYVPIVLDGWNNVKKEILHTGLTSEEADKLEKHYIKKFDSKNKGYNRTDGGKGTQKKSANESEDINRERLNELTNNLIQLCPTLVAPAPNKLLTFQELREMSKITPERLLIKNEEYGACYFITAERANKTIEVGTGGETSAYHWNFLVNWRIWAADPPVSTIINTPWLTQKQVQEYTSYFILDPKVKKFYKEHNTYPSIQDRGFKDYEHKKW